MDNYHLPFGLLQVFTMSLWFFLFFYFALSDCKLYLPKRRCWKKSILSCIWFISDLFPYAGTGYRLELNQRTRSKTCFSGPVWFLQSLWLSEVPRTDSSPRTTMFHPSQVRSWTNECGCYEQRAKCVYVKGVWCYVSSFCCILDKIICLVFLLYFWIKKFGEFSLWVCTL